jgi:D-alanyl-D-alanine carboxypeptidase/D-alanyl-D-alanine-endopeptidase (penicillin-binding protein 4)
MKQIVMTNDARENLPNFEGEVRAKTGTLNFVSTLAGYLRTGQGRDLAFAIFAADGDARARGKAAGDEQPPGAVDFNGKAKRLQQRILQRWALLGGD